MKTLGIILAAGTSSRLFPATLAVTKQLLPIYDKPLIYYPLSTLMLAAIKDVLIITAPDEKATFEKLFHRSDVRLGINLNFTVQEYPLGIADAFKIAKKFYADKINQYDNVVLILGDNIFSGLDIKKIKKSIKNIYGSMIFAYHVHDPERYGVVEFDATGKVLSIEEKPTHPKSNYAVPGIYFYDNSVIDIAANIKPSHRGELEITDVNKAYLEQGKLKVSILDRGTAWLDTGTFQSLMQAGQFVQVIEERQGLKIGAIEEAAYKMGFINADQLKKLAEPLLKSGYGKHLMSLI